MNRLVSHDYTNVILRNLRIWPGCNSISLLTEFRLLVFSKGIRTLSGSLIAFILVVQVFLQKEP